MAEKLKLSMDDLTLGDMELFEEATGQDILEALKPRPVIDDTTGKPVKDPDDPKGRPLMEARVTARVFVGLVYIALRRNNPALTLAEVKAMPLSSIDLDLEESSTEANPTAETEASPTDGE
jgi:hypothetical protein